jgi:hypothetical protein
MNYRWILLSWFFVGLSGLSLAFSSDDEKDKFLLNNLSKLPLNHVLLAEMLPPNSPYTLEKNIPQTMANAFSEEIPKQQKQKRSFLKIQAIEEEKENIKSPKPFFQFPQGNSAISSPHYSQQSSRHSVRSGANVNDAYIQELLAKLNQANQNQTNQMFTILAQQITQLHQSHKELLKELQNLKKKNRSRCC